MWDSMMSRSERDRLRYEHGSDGPGIKFNRTAIGFTLAMSKTLRRVWLLGSLFALLGIPALSILASRIAEVRYPAEHKQYGVWLLVLSGFSFIWGLWGIGLWVKSLFIRWAVRKAQKDYEHDELFN